MFYTYCKFLSLLYAYVTKFNMKIKFKKKIPKKWIKNKNYVCEMFREENAAVTLNIQGGVKVTNLIVFFTLI